LISQVIYFNARHFFAFRPAPDFRETPNFFAVRATLSGGRFSSAATASSDFNDAASCIKRRSSAKDQASWLSEPLRFRCRNNQKRK
jgi:hypothetical protein